MKKILERGGGCVAFICKCCPAAYLHGSGISSGISSGSGSGDRGRLSARRIGMSVFWLETMATKLGTFLPLSEREFLVEALYAQDPDGQQHVSWLAALLLSLSLSLSLARPPAVPKESPKKTIAR